MVRDSSARTGRIRASVVVLSTACLAIGALLGARFGRNDSPHSAPTAAEAAATTLWTCSMHPQVIQDHPGTCPICHMELTPLQKRSQDSALAIDPVVVQSMGVRTARVTRGGASHQLRAYGTFGERTPDHRDITLRVSGRLEELYANIDGLMVAKGEPLFALSSPELNVAIEDLIAAQKQRTGDDADSRALGDMVFRAARSKLVLLGLDEKEIDRLALLDAAPATVTFTSPMDGHAVAIAGYTGSTVNAGDRILRIADNRKLWLDLRVASSDIGRVVGGSTVRARVDAYPGETFDGILTFIHPHFDMQSRTALVRVEIDNAGMRLREGQWASAELELAGKPDALYVPREAVIDTGLRAVVFLTRGQGRFEPRVVVIGRDADDGLVEVSSGLEAGDEVVASGQFLLDSESRLREAVRKFLAPDAGADAVLLQPRPDWDDGVDALVARYLDLADALGKTEVTDAPLDASAFVAAARELSRRAGADKSVAAVLKYAEPLLGVKLSAQRELFKKSSEALLDLVTHVPPSVAIGGSSLYVMNCPMAPGQWLQREPGIRNPFYGRTMKECGELVRPLLLEKAREQ